MAKLNLLTNSSDYTLVEGAQLLYQALEGGLAKTRLDFVDDVEKSITVGWACSPTEYTYLQEFIRQNIADDGPPFDIDLIVGTNLVVEYSARLVPESFKLNGMDGYTFNCTAEILAVPQSLDNDWPEEWDDFYIDLPVDKSQYSLTYGAESLITKNDGGQSKSRRSYFNSAYKASVSWICKDNQFSLLMQAYRAHTAAGGKPFTIPLFVHRAELINHRAVIVPGTFTLTSHGGSAFVVNAQLEVESEPWLKPFTPHLSDLPVTEPSFIGWGDPAAVENEGTLFDVYLTHVDVNIELLAGVVAYSTGTIVWSIDWSAAIEGKPTLTPMAGGVVLVSVPNQIVGFPAYFIEGTATISATVNGVPASNEIELVISDGFYGPVAWGPVP